MILPTHSAEASKKNKILNLANPYFISIFRKCWINRYQPVYISFIFVHEYYLPIFISLSSCLVLLTTNCSNEK